MEFTIMVYLKDYKCYVTEQSGRAKGTRYKAYGHFDDHYIEAQAPSIQSAMKRLKEKAERVLDY